MPISVQGANISDARALQILTVRFGGDDAEARQNRHNKPRYYFDRFCLDHAISIINHEHFFGSMSEFIAEAWEIINKAHEQFDTERTVTWKGKNGQISLSAIPNNHQEAVRNLIANNHPAPGHDRGAHATNPSTGAAGTYTEFDLTAGRDGRATRLNRNGKRAIYYSNSHAFATYKYALVTDNHGRPFLRPGAVRSRVAPPEVPLP